MILLAGLALMEPGCSAGAKARRYTEAGERDYKAGNYDKARIEFLNLLRVDPQNATAYARLGTMWAEEGAPLRAGSFLIKALELAPDDNATRLSMVRVYLAVGRLADARKEAAALLGKIPQSGEALVLFLDASQKPEELNEAELQVAKFPDKKSAYFHLASAGLAAKKNDRAGVEAVLLRAVEADPKLAVAHAALATWYRSQREFDKALAEFEHAAVNAPLRSPERQALAEFKVQLGKLEEANALLKNVTNQAPDFLPAWALQAKIANRQNRYDDALKLIDNALSRDPNNIEARVVQAESWLAKNETKKALDSLGSLNSTYPKTPMIKYAIARAYLQNGSAQQAMGELDEVVRLSPEFPEAVLLHAELRVRSGEAQSVIEPLQKLRKTSPEVAAVGVVLAEAYRVIGRLDDAAALIGEEIKRWPQNASYHAMLGLILRQQSKVVEARAAFEKAIEIDPTNAGAVGQLVELDIANKEFAEGHRRVEQLRQKQPGSGTAYYLEGRLDAAEGKFDLAQNALLKAVEMDPNEIRAYDLLLPVYARANKFPDALKQLNAILAKKPDDARALLLSGLIYDQLKDSNNARAAYEKVLSLTPNAVAALNNLAYIYGEKLNDLPKAGELAQKARALAPSDPSVLDTLGWILYKQGDFQQAAEILGQSAAKNPDSAEIAFHLGMAQYMMGRSELARSALEKAVAAPADFAGKEEARKHLNILDNKSPGGVAELEAATKQIKNDPLGLLRLGEAYEREGSMAKAAEAYEGALAANPKLGAAALKLAELNAGPLKNPDKALQLARKARELAPGDPRAEATAGRIALQLKNASWAYSLLQESARQLPNDAAVLHDLAWAAYGLGRVKEGQDAMQRALDSKPDAQVSGDGQKFLAMLKLGQNDKELVAHENDVNKALATDHDYLPALVARAGIDAAKGDNKAAAASYSRILQQWPDFAPAQRDLAALLIMDPQNVGAAYDLASKARHALGDDPKVATVLARVSYERKDFRQAIQLLETVERQKGLDSLAQYYLGMSYAQAKQGAQARRALTEALQTGLPEPQATQAQQALASLSDR